MKDSRHFRQDLHAVLAAIQPATRRGFWVVAALGLLIGLLEAAGVGAVVPLVVVMTEQDIAARFPAAAAWIPQSLVNNRQALVLVGAALFALVFLVKTGLSFWVAHMQANVLGRFTGDLAARLFSGYLRRPYAFHLGRNAADINSRLIFGVASSVHALRAFSQLLVEGVALLSIVLLLLYVNVNAALITISVIGVPAYVVYRILRRRLRTIGADVHQLNAQAAESTLQALGGIKELKVLGQEATFHGSYARARQHLAEAETQYGVLLVAPRLLLELATVFVVLGLAAVLAAQGLVASIVPILGLYAAAAFRLLPAANRLIAALQTLRYSEAGLRKVTEDLLPADDDGLQSRSQSPLHLAKEIHLDGVSFAYAADQAPVLRNVNLTIRAGECIGFVGQSGAGKSTLMDLLLGLLEPTSGRILVDEVDIRSRVRDWQSAIGYVPQAIYLSDDSIRRNVAFGLEGAHVSDTQVWESLESAQLKEFVTTLPGGLDTVVGDRGVRLSGGQRQRIGIARALYHQPDILVLDEATSSLDGATEADFIRAIDGLHGRKTILIVAHRLSTVAKCDRIVVMHGGEIVDIGTYDQLMANSWHFRLAAGQPKQSPVSVARLHE